LRKLISGSLKKQPVIGARFAKIVLRFIVREIKAHLQIGFAGRECSWGCVQLRAQIAEGVVRAVAPVIMYDNARIKPAF